MNKHRQKLLLLAILMLVALVIKLEYGRLGDGVDQDTKRP